VIGRGEKAARLLAAGAVLVAVLGSGALAGVWTGRWGASQALRAAAARLDAVPLTLGDTWDGHAGELTEREIAVAELEAYLSRRYVHRRTGAAVSVLLVCGRPSAVAAHTPDVCYAGAGYAQVGAARAQDGPGGSRFQVLDFRKRDVAAPTSLRIFLAWSDAGAWSAPANPRLTFAGKPFLYKLYVVREMARPDEPLDEDPIKGLLRDLIPQLEESLLPQAPTRD
jgi:hypothetical protein